MTSGAADPSSLLSYARTNWPLASLRKPEVLKSPAPTGDPGSCPATRTPQNRAISAPGYVRGYLWFRSINHYISWQSTSTLLVTPLVTMTGPEAWQSAVPPSYCGLRPETVYVPTVTGTENRPFAPTVMLAMFPTRPMEGDLSAEGSRAYAGRTTYSLERAGQSPRRTWGAIGR